MFGVLSNEASEIKGRLARIYKKKVDYATAIKHYDKLFEIQRLVIYKDSIIKYIISILSYNRHWGQTTTRPGAPYTREERCIFYCSNT